MTRPPGDHHCTGPGHDWAFEGERVVQTLGLHRELHWAIVGVPGKAVALYETPTAEDSQSPQGDAEKLVLVCSLQSTSNGDQ